jgi:hypothetical protein
VRWRAFALALACACGGAREPARSPSAGAQAWPPRFAGEWVAVCEVHEVCADALRGCRGGDATWCLALGSALEGYGGPRDMVAALSVYLATCEHGVAESCGQAALALALEAPDERASIGRLHERGCTGGALHSCAALLDDAATPAGPRAVARRRLQAACADRDHRDRAWACATLRGEPLVPEGGAPLDPAASTDDHLRR